MLDHARTNFILREYCNKCDDISDINKGSVQISLMNIYTLRHMRYI